MMYTVSEKRQDLVVFQEKRQVKSLGLHSLGVLQFTL